MIYLNAFIFCGLVCVLGQVILDNTKLTPGHVTTIFVILGAFLDTFNIYDKIILIMLRALRRFSQRCQGTGYCTSMLRNIRSINLKNIKDMEQSFIGKFCKN